MVSVGSEDGRNGGICGEAAGAGTLAAGTGRSTAGAFQIAEAHAFLGETDAALDWLERAYRQHDAGLSMIKGDPLLRRLAGDPRHAALLRRLRLPE